VGDLLYVGPATQRKLFSRGISKIGELAQTDPVYLHKMFGKWGDVLHAFANGMDDSPVTAMGEEAMIKSIGNSTTTPRDLENDEDVMMIFYVLCESVAARLRDHGLECRIVEIHVRDNELVSFTRQQKQLRSTNLASEIHRAAMELFKKNYTWSKPIRSLGVRGSDLVPSGGTVQLTFLDDEKERDKIERLEITVDQIRGRYGNFSVQRALLLTDQRLGLINPKDDHVIHPVGYFKAGDIYG
jgi:DNA polymerase-4